MIHQPSVIGRYEIIALLPGGEGGMGLVYRALDPNLARIVALKVLHDSLVTQPDILRRFYAEARAAANLRHPNIITIYDFGEHDGRPFIVMEFIEGQTLKALIESERAPRSAAGDSCMAPLTLALKLSLVEQLCSGLACAHAAGIVHRDIKPANLLYDGKDRLTILDFGIAMIRAASGLTHTQGPIGTLGYMAPEQFDGPGCDRRADIFAAGAVIYELMTGRQAFPGATYTEVMKRVLHDEPTPLSRLCPDLDPSIGKVVEKALRKDPRDRYQDIEELGSDLARVRRGRGTTPPPGEFGDLAEAKQALERGDFGEAARLLEGLLAAWPGRSSVLGLRRQAMEQICERARQCLDEGDRDGAESNARVALRLDPTDAEAQDLLAAITGNVDRPGDDIPVPPTPWYRRPAALLAVLSVLVVVSLATWKAVGYWQTAREVERMLTQAQAFAAASDWSHAIQGYDRVLRLAPDHVEAREKRRQIAENQRRAEGETRFEAILNEAESDIGAGNFEAARAKLAQTLGLDPSNQRAKDLLAKIPPPQPVIDKAQLKSLAQASFLAGRYNAAIAQLGQVLSVDPTDGEALALRQTVLRARSGEVALYLRRATELFEDSGEYDAPLEQVRAALQLDPANKDAAGLRARILKAKSAEEKLRRDS